LVKISPETVEEAENFYDHINKYYLVPILSGKINIAYFHLYQLIVNPHELTQKVTVLRDSFDKCLNQVIEIYSASFYESNYCVFYFTELQTIVLKHMSEQSELLHLVFKSIKLVDNIKPKNPGFPVRTRADFENMELRLKEDDSFSDTVVNNNFFMSFILIQLIFSFFIPVLLFTNGENPNFNYTG
jgi:hypothetical protein